LKRRGCSTTQPNIFKKEVLFDLGRGVIGKIEPFPVMTRDIFEKRAFYDWETGDF